MKGRLHARRKHDDARWRAFIVEQDSGRNLVPAASPAGVRYNTNVEHDQVTRTFVIAVPFSTPSSSFAAQTMNVSIATATPVSACC
jgi:hypothetical protein